MPSAGGALTDFMLQINQDGTHRIVIRTMKGGKSKASKNLSNSTVIARTYVTSPGIPQNVRGALKESAEGLGELVITKA